MGSIRRRAPSSVLTIKQEPPCRPPFCLRVWTSEPRHSSGRQRQRRRRTATPKTGRRPTASEGETESPPSCSRVFSGSCLALLCSAQLCSQIGLKTQIQVFRLLVVFRLFCCILFFPDRNVVIKQKEMGDLRASKVDLPYNLSWKKPFFTSLFY